MNAPRQPLDEDKISWRALRKAFRPVWSEDFDHVTGLRLRYHASRPMFDVVTAIELGDMDRGYKAIDITDTGASVQRHLPTNARADHRRHSQVHQGQAGANEVRAIKAA